MAYSGNLKKRLKSANKSSSNFAVIIGSNEINSNSVIVRNLESGQQENISLDNIITHIEKILR